MQKVIRTVRPFQRRSVPWTETWSYLLGKRRSEANLLCRRASFVLPGCQERETDFYIRKRWLRGTGKGIRPRGDIFIVQFTACHLQKPDHLGFVLLQCRRTKDAGRHAAQASTRDRKSVV